MSATSAVYAGRVAAERQMIDSCTVQTVSGVADPETGEFTPVDTPIYAGKCKVQGLDPLQQNPEVAGSSATVQRYRVDVPVGAFVPAVGQVVTVTASVLDPNLVGNKFRVVALLHKTAATAYRLGVEEGP